MEVAFQVDPLLSLTQLSCWDFLSSRSKFFKGFTAPSTLHAVTPPTLGDRHTKNSLPPESSEEGGPVCGIRVFLGMVSLVGSQHKNPVMGAPGEEGGKGGVHGATYPTMCL